MSRELLEEAGKPTKAGGGAIDVVNTLGWERTDLVIVPATMSRAGDRVREAGGAAVASQRLRTGELAFVATAVPGLGAKRYVFEAGPAESGAAVREGEKARISIDDAGGEGALGNGGISAVICRTSGAVRSLRWDDGGGHELVDAEKQAGLGHYLYVPGTDPATARTVSKVRVRAGESGPLVASLFIESDAPGAKGLTREYRIVSGLNRLDLSLAIDKEKVRKKESVHIAFPFSVPGGQARVDVGWGFVRPEIDQIAGACRDFFCARDSIDVSNEEFGVTWTALDAPLVEIGAITDETPREGERRAWLEKASPSSLVYSYAMNNYWHTNYKADQEGPVTLRYSVAPHRGNGTATVKRLGLEAASPLLPVSADAAAPVPRFPLTLDSPAFAAMSLRPSQDGEAWMLRLLNASDRAETLCLSGKAFLADRVLLSDLNEFPGPPNNRPLEVPAFYILTLRINR
jgi:hypothetical protein